ncbi:aminopeptidase N [Sulfurivirga caldicuralii]|uniref:Aminopeptidase N n=1 Tax=Sulfurivirga caldicuralii TaxID=364032 RepID=A0A1N6FI39_9GAMM|nr:aminopeptidase N [Sulfurivirga caldicuralii]SIN94949.1 aminopeptidase N [Sulfurivirga caldicuralii]
MRAPVEHRLEDYQSPAFAIDDVHLLFQLDPVATRVTSTLAMRRQRAEEPLQLNLENLVVESVALDGIELGESAWRIEDGRLIIEDVPERFTLRIRNRINPKENTALEGLYLSSGNFCTQCEAEGFRRITPFLDRPDVLATYTVRIEADKSAYPVLLSNGNLIEQGDLPDGQHYALWHDPWKKPCYLFALVAGDLQFIEDHYTTAGERDVTLRIYVEPHNIDRCEFAMQALKRAMRWDEERFGLSYDLDVFNIVAVDDFNMGAMENKSLNIFNSKYILARPETATDTDYEGIESVVAHEYFHNWTGNRVTCRDWFQLTLKEGLTVFRDQEFTADMLLPSIKRIQDVIHLRRYQFPEDAGPMAHPIQPKSYIKMDNFYTMTVYEKGAEVVRIYQTLLGREGFRKGMDLYFQRHDGQAVTVDDFRQAMADANGVDLSSMRAWYDQPGTPHVKVRRHYDADSQRLTLDLTQSLPKVGEGFTPLPIPIRLGLLDASGNPLPLVVGGEELGMEYVHLFDTRHQQLVLEQVPEGAVPALLRDFSAPVILETDLDDAEWALLAAHDPDDFLRWDALNTLALKALMEAVTAIERGEAPAWPQTYLDAVGVRLQAALEDPAWHALALTLPDEVTLGEQFETIAVEAIHQARKALQSELAQRFEVQWASIYDTLSAELDQPYTFNAEQYGKRSLRTLALHYLVQTGKAKWIEQALYHYQHANNMTDRFGALRALTGVEHAARKTALDDFYYRFRNDPLVIDKWFALQAGSDHPHTLEHVRMLTRHPDFTYTNPNRVRSLLGVFGQNRAAFHRADGSGYVFLADEILKVDKLNPQIAARLLSPFTQWRRFDTARQALMKAQLERILQVPSLSSNSYEIVEKSLTLS